MIQRSWKDLFCVRIESISRIGFREVDSIRLKTDN